MTPSGPPRWSTPPYRVLNLVAFLPLIVGNALAGAGRLSGESIGVVANRWPTLLLPAGWAFGIWSLIYLGLAAFVVFQALPNDRARWAAGRIGPLWLVTVVLNLAWITAFSFSRFAVALMVMAALLGSLVAVFARLDIGAHRVAPAERLLVQIPFSLYLGWITIAFVVNAAQYLSYRGWAGEPFTPLAWAVAMMVGVTVIGALFHVRRGEWVVPLVVAWALAAIGARNPDRGLLVTVAWTLAAVSVAVPVVLRRAPTGGDGGAGPQPLRTGE